MATMVTVHTQVTAEIQERAAELLALQGLTVEEAVCQMLTRTVESGQLPFSADDSSLQEDPAYDAWYRKKVQEALDEPGPGIPHAEVRRRMEIRRAEAKAKVG